MNDIKENDLRKGGEALEVDDFLAKEWLYFLRCFPELAEEEKLKKSLLASSNLTAFLSRYMSVRDESAQRREGQMKLVVNFPFSAACLLNLLVNCRNLVGHEGFVDFNKKLHPAALLDTLGYLNCLALEMMEKVETLSDGIWTNAVFGVVSVANSALGSAAPMPSSRTSALNIYRDVYLRIKSAENDLKQSLIVGKSSEQDPLKTRDLVISFASLSNIHLVSFDLHSVDFYHQTNLMYFRGTAVAPLMHLLMRELPVSIEWFYKNFARRIVDADTDPQMTPFSVRRMLIRALLDDNQIWTVPGLEKLDQFKEDTSSRYREAAFLAKANKLCMDFLVGMGINELISVLSKIYKDDNANMALEPLKNQSQLNYNMARELCEKLDISPIMLWYLVNRFMQ